MLKEFKEFALKGSVVDLAVGVVIGGAFGKIVDSLVNDVIMPPIGVLIGGVDFSNLFIVLKRSPDPNAPSHYASLADAKIHHAVTLNFGVFINTVISFIIVAAAIFMVIKVFYRLKLYHQPPPAGPSKTEVLLEEIRDLLKKNQ